MSDKIAIQGLQVWSRIGVPEEERAEAQKLEIDITFEIETVKEAAQSDLIEHTVNYFHVAQTIREIAESGERKLIETLAEELSEKLLYAFPLKGLTLEIRKFIIPDCRHVSLRIKRKTKKKKTDSSEPGF